MILPDNETKVDLLNNEAIAKTIVKLLRERPEHPVTVGVHGDWGAGKSSVLEMIEASLEGDHHVLCLKFNGWRFQGFEDAKIALIEGIVTGLIEKRPLVTKAAEAVKDVFHRIDWLKVAKKAGGLALTAYTGIPSFAVEALVGKLQSLVTDPTTLSAENVGAALTEAKGFLKEAETKHVPEEIAGFRKAFDELLKLARVQQLVVLIDDLDRCLPDTAIETLEAVRLFLFSSRTAFVVAADEVMIEYAVRKHFPNLPDTTGPQSYARKYLEKLIQVPFRIPALGQTETLIYVTLLLIGAEIGESDPAFVKLIAAARELLKRPWAGGSLDASTVKSALEGKFDQAQNALVLSAQIGPLLASGTEGNPRQIKRFLNTLLLRQSSAEARGFGDDVKRPVLAKLMLAERFLERVFDQIATAAATSTDGSCPDLALLEAGVSDNETSVKPATEQTNDIKAPARAKSAAKLEVVNPVESAQLAEWMSSKTVKSWAQIPPAIGTLDLRPYLFVAKDRKDYFGATSILGQLATVAEKLLGPKFSVQAYEKDLAKLALPEASQVFDAVRGRIINSDSFDTEPAGVAGLAVLVKVHSSLQGNLLDFLEGLPRDRVGPWVCAGWEGVITEPGMIQRFERLLELWSKDGAAFLKTTASTALRTRKQGLGR
ncbi:MAG: NTPase KAP [Verrucomicrobia bacterium]|nr:NTPase KAP [Verrucomicrobiota bacterium]